MARNIGLAAGSLLALVSCRAELAPSTLEESFGPQENPWSIERLMPRHFDEGRLSGRLTRIPWTDSYYPTTYGGIAARYFALPENLEALSEEGLRRILRGYRPVTRDATRSMRLEELAVLSPAEKYELLMGDQAKGFAKAVLAENFESAPGWSGLCHGWAAASLVFDEPRAVTVSSDGLRIPFASSDIKALLIYFQGEVARKRYPAPGGFLGRCDIQGICEGSLNPGALHLVLTHMIGRRDKGIILDMARGAEKWNFPVFSYKAKVIDRSIYTPRPRAGVARQVAVRNEISYVVESWPAWDPIGPDPEYHTTVPLCYTLELDATGRITGGEWVDDFPAPHAQDCNKEAPDFAWVKERAQFHDDEWRGLEALYAQATGR